MDEVLPVVLYRDGKKYALYGDSGYSDRVYWEVLFQRSSLTSYEAGYRKAMSTEKVPLEWMFKEI